MHSYSGTHSRSVSQISLIVCTLNLVLLVYFNLQSNRTSSHTLCITYHIPYPVSQQTSAQVSDQISFELNVPPCDSCNKQKAKHINRGFIASGITKLITNINPSGKQAKNPRICHVTGTANARRTINPIPIITRMYIHLNS